MSLCSTGSSWVPPSTSPPSPPWKWTIAVNFLSRVTFRDMPGSFYWSWEIGKRLNFSCTKILLFPLKWISNTPDSSLLKWKYENACKNQKEELSLAVSCFVSSMSLPACLAFANRKIVSVHAQADGQTEDQIPREKLLWDFESLISFFRGRGHPNKRLLSFMNIFLYILRWTYITCVCAKLLQSCLILCNPMDCRLPGSSVLGILQERIMEWVALPTLLQGIFPTQGLNPGLPHCRQTL